ncbi:hypothetical protein AAHC03_04680 [Spirometra sp. Aus1]
MLLPESKQTLSIEISEGSEVGERFSIPPALDLDSGQAGLIKYAIWPALEEFRVDGGADDIEVQPSEMDKGFPSAELSLVLAKKLDRELRDFYSFTIVATDMGVKPFSSSIDVIVKVLDENDNSPLFSQSDYEVTVSEGTIPYTRIFKVHATDADIGQNAAIEYKISPLTEPKSVRMVKLDTHSGWLSTEWKLDFETQKSLLVIVEAHDLGQPPRHSTCQVRIRILDENDNAPQIVFEPGSLTNYALVPENEEAGRIVAVFTATDEDSEENGQVDCLISSVSPNGLDGQKNQINNGLTSLFTTADVDVGTFFELEKIELPFSTVFQLRTAATLDREAAHRYRVGVTCSDKGTPPQNTTGFVVVRVLDVNDFAPSFSKAHYVFSLPEDQPLNSTVFNLTATDYDEDSGVVKLRQGLDREMQNQLTLTVIALDRGIPTQTGSADITVAVADVNDNAPTVTSKVTFSIFENHSAVTPIGTLTASDPDTGLNGQFFFKQMSVSPCLCRAPGRQRLAVRRPALTDEGLCTWISEMPRDCETTVIPEQFRRCGQQSEVPHSSWTGKEYQRFLVTENGRIYLRFSDLDRESTPVYVLHLAVIDRGSPPRASNFCVTVVVKDVNDCNPKFLFPVLNNNSITVFLPIQKGATVAQVQAIDDDDLENANLQFSFTEDSDPLVRSLFTIDATSGWITMKRFVSAEELQLPGTYQSKAPVIFRPSCHVKVQVTDQGKPPLTSAASLHVRFQSRLSEGGGDSLQTRYADAPESSSGHDPDRLAMAEEIHQSDSLYETNSQTNLIMVVFCAFFLVILLLLTTVLLVILGCRFFRTRQRTRTGVLRPPVPCTVYMSPVCRNRSTFNSTHHVQGEPILGAILTKGNYEDATNLSLHSETV